MNCPRCGGNLQEKQKSVMSIDKEGVKNVDSTENVLFCRDCHINIKLRKAPKSE